MAAIKAAGGQISAVRGFGVLKMLRPALIPKEWIEAIFGVSPSGAPVDKALRSAGARGGAGSANIMTSGC